MSIDLEAIRARAAAATKGSWKVVRPGHEHSKTTKYRCVQMGKSNTYTTLEIEPEDAAFIAHARADIPALCDEVDRLRKAVQSHYDQRGDDRCHLDDLKLYHDALGIEPDPYVTALPIEADMIESRRRYIRQRQAPETEGLVTLPDCMTIQQLTEEVKRLRKENAELAQYKWIYEGLCK